MNTVAHYSVDERNIATIYMQDHQRKNTLSEELMRGVIASLERAEKERPSVIILRGLPEVFSAGAERSTLEGLTRGELHVKDVQVSEQLLQCSIPLIAAVEGHAMGGGLVMAVCCDIVVAALESRYGAVFITMGFTPGMGCTKLLEYFFGVPLAHEMMYSGQRFKGRELAQMATNVNRWVAKERVYPTACDIAARIAQNNPKALSLLKYTLSAPKRHALVEARVQEDLMHRVTFAYPETQKNIAELYADLQENT